MCAGIIIIYEATLQKGAFLLIFLVDLLTYSKIARLQGCKCVYGVAILLERIIVTHLLIKCAAEINARRYFLMSNSF